MDEILDALNRVPGVMGCLVATTDGMVVASRLHQDLDEDAAAALVSSLISGTAALLDGCGRPRIEQLIMKATRGKIIVTDLNHAYLVVVTDRNLDFSQGLVEVRSAAANLRRLTCIAN
jgi:predicted regulator of Ras-like GTPase activity (Roadblock/LC7/MglB family)